LFTKIIKVKNKQKTSQGYGELTINSNVGMLRIYIGNAYFVLTLFNFLGGREGHGTWVLTQGIMLTPSLKPCL
jgi:hypothetical protein